MINVTGFFRDPGTFDFLKSKVFPAIFGGRRSDDDLRVWVPGCATGEEVYSIAICLMEYLGDEAVATPVKFFGTDIREDAIARARTGFYLANISTEVSAERPASAGAIDKPDRAASLPPSVLEVQREVDRVVVSRAVPSGVVIDKNLEILQFRGDTGRYLKPAPGIASLNLLKMAREGLLTELRNAVTEAQNTGVTVTRGDAQERA